MIFFSGFGEMLTREIAAEAEGEKEEQKHRGKQRNVTSCEIAFLGIRQKINVEGAKREKGGCLVVPFPFVISEARRPRIPSRGLFYKCYYHILSQSIVILFLLLFYAAYVHM